MKTTITDRHGNIEQELSYDPWGTRRNPDTWHNYSVAEPVETPMFDRGFTGHEHLYAFGLINMNGRIYDPQMSSFLSVDAYVQSPDNAQSFNRYAYCQNNPLRYVDPSGWLMLGAGHGTSFNNNPGWGESYSQHAYEPRELGMLQLPGCSVMTWWMEGEKMLVGGGGGVKPAGQAELTMIKNTLPKEAQKYVTINEYGYIDKTLLNSCTTISLNVSLLKILANSAWTIEVVLDDGFTYVDKEGKKGYTKMPFIPYDPLFPEEIDTYGQTMSGLSTGESGYLGETLFPDLDGSVNSPNNNIIVIINSNLSIEGAAEVYSHEANGHALLYTINGGYREGAIHQPGDMQIKDGNMYFPEGNKILMYIIIHSKRETIYNMKGL